MSGHEPELPEGVIVTSTVCVVSWIAEHGDMRYAVKTTGDVPLSTQLGLLDLARLDLYHAANVDPSEDP